MVDTHQPVCEAHVMKRTPQPGRFFPLRRRHVPVPPDRRPRTINVTLVGPGTRWGHIQASDLLSYARKQPDCRVAVHPDGTATITVTRKPRISAKQKT